MIKEGTLHVMCKLYKHIVPSQLLIKMREIAQGEVSVIEMHALVLVIPSHVMLKKQFFS